MLNELGMTKNALDAISQNNFRQSARFNPTSSQYAGFDPTSKGGLLRIKLDNMFKIKQADMIWKCSNE